MWICGAFVYIGARTTTGTDIGLIYAVSAVLIAVASADWFGDRLSARQTVGLVVAVTGVLLILLQGSPAAPPGIWLATSRSTAAVAVPDPRCRQGA